MPRQHVFLHAGWRSGGTALWQCLRDLPGAVGFDEPLHEVLAREPAEVLTVNPESWDSGHDGAVRPYFAEYGPLLRPGGALGYEPRFAVDRWFPEAEEPDPALEGWLGRLLAVAEACGSVAVLKLCRSGGRVPWLREHLGGLHVAVIRDLAAQYESFAVQLERHGNPYFVAMAALVAVRNAGATPILAELVERTGIPDPGGDAFAAWPSISGWALDATAADRADVALTVCALASSLAARDADVVVSVDELATDGTTRDELVELLGDLTGLAPDLASLRPERPTPRRAEVEAWGAERWPAISAAIAPAPQG